MCKSLFTLLHTTNSINPQNNSITRNYYYHPSSIDEETEAREVILPDYHLHFPPDNLELITQLHLIDL